MTGVVMLHKMVHGKSFTVLSLGITIFKSHVGRYIELNWCEFGWAEEGVGINFVVKCNDNSKN